MEIIIKDAPTSIEEITVQEYNVHQINSISKKYPEYRNNSKPVTFAMAYGGTPYTLEKNCGFTPSEAQEIADRYHQLYTESDDWITQKLDECCELGYATVAFGLRIRTPILSKSILNTNATARISSSEARSVGNAISGQSYGLLNNRAAVAFMNKVWASEYKYDIFPIAQIHDASYFIIKDDINVLKFVNDHLIEEMAWQNLPELHSDKVKLESELDLFHPSWNEPITLSNNLSRSALKEAINKGINQ